MITVVVGRTMFGRQVHERTKKAPTPWFLGDQNPSLKIVFDAWAVLVAQNVRKKSQLVIEQLSKESAFLSRKIKPI